MSSAVDATTSPDSFDERAARALTKPMTVLDNRLDHDLRDEEFLVVTPTGTYTVEMVSRACTCH